MDHMHPPVDMPEEETMPRTDRFSELNRRLFEDMIEQVIEELEREGV